MDLTLWTVQRRGFDLSKPGQKYDPTLGFYWNDAALGERYRELLPHLHGHFQVDAILWCRPTLATWWLQDHEVVWKLNVPPPLLLGRFNADRWNEAVNERPGSPIILERLDAGTKCPEHMMDVLVRWPLPPGSARKIEWEPGYISSEGFEAIKVAEA